MTLRSVEGFPLTRRCMESFYFLVLTYSSVEEKRETSNSSRSVDTHTMPKHQQGIIIIPFFGFGVERKHKNKMPLLRARLEMVCVYCTVYSMRC